LRGATISSGDAQCIWADALTAVAQARKLLERLQRIAVYVNDPASVKKLTLPATGTRVIDVGVIARPGIDAGDMVKSWSSFSADAGPVNVACRVIQVSDYTDIRAEVAAPVAAGAAIVFLSPLPAPALDEVFECIRREFAGCRPKILIAISSVDCSDELADGMIGELREEAGEIPVIRAGDVPGVLADLLARTQVPAVLDDLRATARSAAEQLLPLVRSSVEFLSCGQPQFLRRMEFIRRDLAALKELEGRAGGLLAQISDAGLQRANAAIDGLSAAMQKRAEAAVESALVPRELLATQETRTGFGRNLAAAARAAAFHEYEQRVQSCAMDLNSARSLLLSNFGQIRVEAESHFEELTLNLGMDLFASWLGPKAPGWSTNPLDISLDPGAGIATGLSSAAQRIRQGLQAPDFVSAWATGRIERMFKSEIVMNAVAGWSPNTLDQPLAAAVRQTWHRDTERPCGLLIGRLRAIVEAVTAGLANQRLDSLRLPRLASNRGRMAEVFRGFAADLESILSDDQKDPA
jgi:hypothetical protein